MSQDKVNGLVPPDQEANTDVLKQPTPSATTKTIEEILKQHWFDYIDAEHKVKGNNSDRLRHADEEALAAINNYTTQRVIEELEKLWDSLQMFYLLGDDTTKYDALRWEVIKNRIAELKGGIDDL